MTIDDKIRDEKWQYDINRDAAKITPLSSGKIDKYEYLTGEEILPSNQRQIIEQAKVAYSPLGKAFEKQRKAIEDLGEKQIKAIEDNKKQLGNNELLLSKEREIFKNIYNKRLNKITELTKKIDYGDLKIIVNSSGLDTDFSELKDPVAFLDSIKKREISMEEARHEQEEFNRYLTKIRIGNNSEKQKKTLANFNKLFNRRNDAFKFCR